MKKRKYVKQVSLTKPTYRDLKTDKRDFKKKSFDSTIQELRLKAGRK